MKEENISAIVPANEVGRALDLQQSVTEATIDDAQQTFKRAIKRLQNPPIWNNVSGTLSASFRLGRPNEKEPERLLALDDYILIDIPGPGSIAGEGYDWVQVESINESPVPEADESFGLILKAVPNPDKPEQGAAHFFATGATSTFVIKREGLNVTATYHGRNEVANTEEPGRIDRLRNAIIAAGAKNGVSDLQWTALLKGLLNPEIGGW